MGIPLSDWNLPFIKRLLVSAPGGNSIEQDLPLGGFGISRYKLDAALANICHSMGVVLLEETKVTDVFFEQKQFVIRAGDADFQSKLVCGSFGKRSNLDVRWKRPFTRKKNNKLNNYIGIKYHIRSDFPGDLIALHNFEYGYCGISQIEDNKFCLCYLTTAKNLRRNNNSIALMEKNILRLNPYLEKIFSTAEFLFEQPVTISQISFEKKSTLREHIFFVGDAAGMITPLCGNGMSMAMHASKIAFECMDLFLKGEIERHEMEQEYVDRWNRQFRKRLRFGRLLQAFFGNRLLTHFLIASLKPFPGLVGKLIQKTHGQPF
jgi:flavin-dependent dehydrogenase